MRCGRDMLPVKRQLGMVAKSLGAVSENPDNDNCAGVGVDILKTLDRMPSSQVGLQYPFSIQALPVEKLLRKSSFSVMDQMDMLGC